jgi:hypothetical protein
MRRTARLKMKMVTGGGCGPYDCPLQFLDRGTWRNNDRGGWQQKRLCEADAAADRAEIGREVGGCAWLWRMRCTGLTGGYVGQYRHRWRSDADIANMNVAKSENELAGQRKKRQPTTPATV